MWPPSLASRPRRARTSTKPKVSLAFVGRKTAAAKRSKHACACKIRPGDRARDVGRPVQRAAHEVRPFRRQRSNCGQTAGGPRLADVPGSGVRNDGRISRRHLLGPGREGGEGNWTALQQARRSVLADHALSVARPRSSASLAHGCLGYGIRGTPYHPMTQGKIERWHLTLKNRILLENYYLPGQLEARIEAFVAPYNHLRYHESIDNLTPADVYFGRGQTILLERERIKRKTIQHRRLHHKTHAA